jgi:hypothetical protein
MLIIRLGEYGRIYKGELVDTTTHQCLIKSLQMDCTTEQTRDEYEREIESTNRHD